MLNPDDVADSIIHAINAPGITTVEEFTIRRVGGDFQFYYIQLFILAGNIDDSQIYRLYNSMLFEN